MNDRSIGPGLTPLSNAERRLFGGRIETVLRVATAPVNWNNGDLAGWTPHVGFPRLLDEMAAAGYTATEYGDEFGPDARIVAAALKERHLSLCGAYRWLRLTDPDGFTNDLADLQHTLDLLAALDCHDLIVAIAMTPHRVALAGRVPSDGSESLSSAEWRLLAQNLEVAADLAAVHGIRTHFHNHVGSHVESPAEVERLIEILPAGKVDLCFDTGHYAFGGGDPVEFVARHRTRIGYLHLKDVDGEVLNQMRARQGSFLDALRAFIFCDLGHGVVDIKRIVGLLDEPDRDRWLVVEQDTCPNNPTETARANRAYLHDQCGI